MKDWYLAKHGINLFVDYYPLPVEYNIVAVDVETDEADRVYSVAICGEDKKVYVYFDIQESLFHFLKSCRKIFHNGKADCGWLGMTTDDIFYDTMIGAYVLHSGRKSYGLKKLVKEDLEISYPSYTDITEGKEYIEEACQDKPELYVVKHKHFKTKPSKEIKKLPSKLTLPFLRKETVANYNGWDAVVTWRLYKRQGFKSTETDKKYLEKIEMPTYKVLAEVERNGIQVDLKKLLELHKKFSKEARNSKRQFGDVAGKEVLISSPLQVKDALRKLGIKAKSTNEDGLVEFKNTEAVKHLLDYRGYAKICNTYTKPLFKLGISAPDNRVHCRFPQNTITGRLSSSKPNLQNQPPETREAFVARHGHTFINLDYSQIELRIPAHFSYEPIMVKAFTENLEKFHEVTARECGVEYKVGKQINFLLSNGGQAPRLAEVAEIPLKEAEEAMERFWSKFSVFREWLRREKAMAVMNMGMRTMFGRWVPIPELRAKWFGARQAAERTAISVKVQGSASEIIKKAMIEIYKKHKHIPVVSVHDELMFEVPTNEVEKWAPIYKYEMENVVKLRVPLVADVGYGPNWAIAKEQAYEN